MPEANEHTIAAAAARSRLLPPGAILPWPGNIGGLPCAAPPAPRRACLPPSAIPAIAPRHTIGTRIVEAMGARPALVPNRKRS
ncbi:MAG: hypothetical protein AB7K86_06250 [Rhodospirillales bacterium]